MPIGTRLLSVVAPQSASICDASCARPPSAQRPDRQCAPLSSTPPRPHSSHTADAPLSRAPSPAPRAGELHLWRFRCEWLPVPVQEGDSWLSKIERERARLHPNAALRKRFVSARVVVRWIVGNLFDCEPRAVDLQDDGNEKLRARHPHDGRGITIDIAYGGIWIVIGIASATLGLERRRALARRGCPTRRRKRSRRRARYGSLCNALRYAPVDVDMDLLSAKPRSAHSISRSMAAGTCSMCRWPARFARRLHSRSRSRKCIHSVGRRRWRSDNARLTPATAIHR